MRMNCMSDDLITTAVGIGAIGARCALLLIGTLLAQALYSLIHGLIT